ncbi:MAG: hypothetical protein ACPGTQ_01885 [Colwellia sp.]
MTAIESDIDFILKKTYQLFELVEHKKYHLIESRELVRKQLIDQFFIDYLPEEIITVQDKLDTLIELTSSLTQACESLFQQTKDDILKVRKSGDVIKAYK